MAENDAELARVQMVREHLRQRGRICYGMITGGMICLAAGVAMLVVGLTGDQVVWFQSGSFKITAGGFGTVTMLASVAWDTLHIWRVLRLNLKTLIGTLA
jgi:hypothetical protein